jgi:hypothetical protein
MRKTATTVKFGPAFSSDNSGDGPVDSADTPTKKSLKARVNGTTKSRGNTELPEVARANKRSLEAKNNPKRKRGSMSDKNKRILNILLAQDKCCSKAGEGGCFASKFRKADNSIDYVKAFEVFKSCRHEADTYSDENRKTNLTKLFLSASNFDEKSQSWTRNDVSQRIRYSEYHLTNHTY